jgi:hypothetical protein
LNLFHADYLKKNKKYFAQLNEPEPEPKEET